MKWNRETVAAKVASALKNVLEDEGLAPGVEVGPASQLVGDLGFDSVRIASLTIALEDEFDDVLLLSDWIAEASNPSELTVASLVDYLVVSLADGL